MSTPWRTSRPFRSDTGLLYKPYALILDTGRDGLRPVGAHLLSTKPISKSTVSLSVPPRELLTVADTAKRLNVSRRTVRRLIARGELRAVQLGGRGAPVRIDPDELDRWLYADPEQAA